MTYRRIYTANHKKDPKPPYDAELKADVSMKIEWLIRIVPPSGMEQFIKKSASE